MTSRGRRSTTTALVPGNHLPQNATETDVFIPPFKPGPRLSKEKIIGTLETRQSVAENGSAVKSVSKDSALNKSELSVPFIDESSA